MLTNDTDADNDTLTVLGASDGIYGTTTVNANNTITYTPAANWYGTDWFTYVIDDGHGRLAYATATVTVVQGGTVTGRVVERLRRRRHPGLQHRGGVWWNARDEPRVQGEPGFSGFRCGCSTATTT